MDSNKEVKRRRDRLNDNEDFIGRSKKRRSRSRSRNDDRSRGSWRKRNRSRSKSPGESVKRDKRRDDAPKDISSKHEGPTIPRKAKETDMLNTRTGGAYIPPARLRMMQAQITDKSSVAYQRLAWEALKKSIHGHINKINVGNIGIIIKQLLKENIVRGRGLLCRSVIQAQAASPTFTNVYAALVSAVNSRFPNIGELLLKRLVIQFKRGFKRNDKAICISSASFIAHLVNQKVAHEIVALELLTLLVETPTDDSVEVSIAFLKECGQKLTEVSSKGVSAIFEMLRNILHEGKLDKRVQYMIEVVFQVWKDGFKDHPAVIEELELVPEEEQFTHLLMLDDATNAQDILNVFKFDDKYEENEQKYKALCGEILGSDAESGEEGGSGESGSEESEEEDEKQKEVTIIDNTETNLVALRRTIYLTINSSLDFEECAHKLMKMQLKPGQEVELCHMFLDCCAEQRTYEKFYGLLAQRFCNINRIYISPFEEIFKDSYATAHRLDTNRLRNVSKFFAHLLFTDSISWEALDCVKLNEEDTTSSSRIYIKILFQELAEYMGLKKLNDRLKDPTLQQAFSGIFPRDNPKNSRFSINFFTSIGLGGLTDELREHLKQMPKNIPPPITEINIDSDSSSDSSSSSSDSSSNSSDSSSSESETEKERSEKKKKKNSKNKTPKTPEVEAPPKDKESDKTERWGHDGFYDTYGQDARRKESNSARPIRNKDTLSKNRHESTNNYEDRYRNYEQENDREHSHRNREREERPPRSFEGKDRPDEFDRREKRFRDIDNHDKYSDNDPRRSRNDRDRRNRDDQRSGRYEREFEKNIARRSQEKDSRRDKDDQRSKRHEREDEICRNRDVRRDREKDNQYGEDDIDRTRNDKESRREKEDKNTHERENLRRNRDMYEDKEKDKNRDKTTETKFVEGDSKKNRDEINSRKVRKERTDTHNECSNEATRNRETRTDLEDGMSNKNNKEVLESRQNDRLSRRDKESKKNKSREDREKVGENDACYKSNRPFEDDKREDQYISNRKHKDGKNEKVKKKKSDEKDHGKYESSDEVTKESKSKKRHKKSKKEKENLRNDTDSETDQSNSDCSQDKKDLGGRYWDNFDINSKSDKEVKENDSYEARTPEMNEKYYERKRER